jgi:hypothetical protein
MKVRIFIGDRVFSEAELKRSNEDTVPSVGDFVEFRTDHDERRWVARVTDRLFYFLPTETIVEISAQPEVQ